ncbi:MAG: hypothetical protein D6771_09010, partial [Zetaproteobacteria bacterium]
MLSPMRLVATLTESLERLIFPPICVLCEAKAQGAFCARCMMRLHPWPRHACRHCGRMLPRVLGEGPCGACAARRR